MPNQGVKYIIIDIFAILASALLQLCYDLFAYAKKIVSILIVEMCSYIKATSGVPNNKNISNQGVRYFIFLIA